MPPAITISEGIIPTPVAAIGTAILATKAAIAAVEAPASNKAAMALFISSTICI